MFGIVGFGRRTVSLRMRYELCFGIIKVSGLDFQFTQCTPSTPYCLARGTFPMYWQVNSFTLSDSLMQAKASEQYTLPLGVMGSMRAAREVWEPMKSIACVTGSTHGKTGAACNEM